MRGNSDELHKSVENISFTDINIVTQKYEDILLDVQLKQDN